MELVNSCWPGYDYNRDSLDLNCSSVSPGLRCLTSVDLITGTDSSGLPVCGDMDHRVCHGDSARPSA